MEPELKKRNKTEIDLKEKWVWEECEEFADEIGIYTEDVEEALYLIKKEKYQKEEKLSKEKLMK
jgi:hypothetical protein